MATKRKELPELQRAVLEQALKTRRGKILFPKRAAETLSTTYSALLSLERRKLIEAEPMKQPDVLSWKVTKAGRSVLDAKPTTAKPRASAR